MITAQSKAPVSLQEIEIKHKLIHKCEKRAISSCSRNLDILVCDIPVRIFLEGNLDPNDLVKLKHFYKDQTLKGQILPELIIRHYVANGEYSNNNHPIWNSKSNYSNLIEKLGQDQVIIEKDFVASVNPSIPEVKVISPQVKENTVGIFQKLIQLLISQDLIKSDLDEKAS